MKKIFWLLSFVCLSILCLFGINSSTKTVANANNGYLNPQDNKYITTGGGSIPTFGHIDIQSVASFTYYVDGKPVTVNINFYEDESNLSNVNIYRKNKDNTLTAIPVSGSWRNQSNQFGGVTTEKEYSISGDFPRYYDNISKEEVIYVVEFTLSVTIGGVEQELVYTEEYSYNSDNNVCPGKQMGFDQGIDVLISGTKLEEYFSSSLKIKKNVENAEDNTFKFNIKAVNSNIDFNKDIEITTKNNTGFITIGGLKAGEKYEITEIDIPEGYELVGNQPITITAEKNKTIKVTFTNRAKTIDITGEKTWNDNDNQDGIRPDSITVNLLKNGKIIDSVEVTQDNNWNYSFNNLPEYEDNKKITYTLEEVSVNGYETEINGYDIINTHTPEKIEVSGTKTWKDKDNQDGIRPTSITVNLLKNGKKIDSKEVTAKGNWSYTFENLYKYESGEEITYTVEEETVNGYETEIDGYDIINTHTPEKIEVSGSKTWEDKDNQDGIRPTSITVNLLKNGSIIDSKEVTAEDNWSYTFENLNKYEAGKEITYTIEEETVAGYKTEIDGYDITNTHKPETIEVSGTKTWNDKDNQDGIRPTSITVNLLKNGSIIDSKEVTAEDNWSYTFKNLNKYEAGKEITYTIEEETVAGYETKITDYDITNTHIPSIIKVSGEKTWSDNNNQDGVRPDKITVRLYANGKEINSKEVTAEDNWTYSFDNLPEYENGSKIEYTIKEDSVKEYTTIINGYNITNIHEVEKTTVSGTKEWIDNYNQDGIRPASITVNLLKNGSIIDSKEVTAEDNWTYTFENLNKYEEGKEITYTVTEETVNGYETKIDGYNITNTHTPETTMVMGQKKWNDSNNQDGIRPNEITVNLYADGQKVNSATVTKGENNDWTYAFINLPKYKNGNEIKYTVTEDKVEGYTTTYSKENPYIIINTHQTKTVDIIGEKTWDDNNNQDGKRPDKITVRLYANGEEITSKEVKEQDNWTYSFTDLDMYKEGKLISYTISEDAIEGYSTVIDGYNITNTHTPEQINVSGEKTWNDNNNQDGKRPESIIINLLKNGKKIDSKEVTEEDNWTYTFENLAKYESGKEISYTLTEESVDSYETVINGYDITNTHEIEKITFKATKIWEDNDNQDGIRQKEVNVKLYKNGELFDEVKITETDNWTYIFENLDRYENGQEIIYTIVEDVVLGYETEINYEDIDENNIVSATIINTHTPEQISIDINKTWDDNNNSMSLRPNSIDVDLYANGEYLKTISITDKNNWKYSITGLDKYQNGEEIVYSILEKPVNGYTTTYDKFNITNTIEFGKGGDVEILPPQTGIVQEDTNYSTNLIALIFAGLLILIHKFI